MKKSINRLPKRTQQELSVLVDFIKRNVKNCAMIILYGSYAKGTHVFWDERFDFGTHTTFQSDLDILVILSKNTHIPSIERQLDNEITDGYERIFDKLRPTSPNSNVIRYAPPQFIVEYIGSLNNELEKSQYFYTDIVRGGILLYNAEGYELSRPRKLLYREIKEIAVKDYEVKMERGNRRLSVVYFFYNKEMYVDGSFDLHQVCEKYYNAIGLVFNNYSPKMHDLEKLLRRIKKYSKHLITVFPLNTDFEKRCYDLICRAYIEARYNPDFVVTKEELGKITHRLCKERIEY